MPHEAPLAEDAVRAVGGPSAAIAAAGAPRCKFPPCFSGPVTTTIHGTPGDTVYIRVRHECDCTKGHGGGLVTDPDMSETVTSEVFPPTFCDADGEKGYIEVTVTRTGKNGKVPKPHRYPGKPPEGGGERTRESRAEVEVDTNPVTGAPTARAIAAREALSYRPDELCPAGCAFTWDSTSVPPAPGPVYQQNQSSSTPAPGSTERRTTTLVFSVPYICTGGGGAATPGGGGDGRMHGAPSGHVRGRTGTRHVDRHHWPSGPEVLRVAHVLLGDRHAGFDIGAALSNSATSPPRPQAQAQPQ